MKKILCLMLVSLLVFPSTAFALCEREFQVSAGRNLATKNDLVCMDFTKLKPGDNPGFDIQDDSSSIIKTEGLDGNEQSAYCLTDTTPELSYNSGSNVRKNIPATKTGIVKVELRFKYERVTTNWMAMNIFIYGSSTGSYLHRVYVAENDMVPSLQSAGNGTFTFNDGNGVKPDTWYTFTAMLNLDKSTINSKLVEHNPDGDYVTYREAFNFSPDYISGEDAVNQLHLQTNTGDGKIIVDYIKVETSQTDEVIEYVYPGPLPLPYAPTPAPKAVEGITNVKYNGEYMYFNEAPRFEGDSLYVASRDALMALGFKVSYENGALVGTKDGVRLELKAGSSDVVFNGNTHKLTKPVTNDNRAIVSITELASFIGATSSYDAALNEYIIQDKEAVQ